MQNHSSRRANGTDRCTHAGDQYDTSPSIGYHNFGGFTSGKISPMNIDIKEFPSAIKGVTILAVDGKIPIEGKGFLRAYSKAG